MSRDDLHAICVEVKSRIDLRQLAPTLGVERKGAGWLCPFHADTTPSFGIVAQGYSCFACQAKGDAIKLVQHIKRVDFLDALEWLAGVAGVALPPLPRRRCGRPKALPPPATVPVAPPEPVGPVLLMDRRSEILTALVRDIAPFRWYSAAGFLARRGIGSATTKAARLGAVVYYRKTSYALQERFPLVDLQATGLFNAKGNFRLFKHTLLWPYWLDGRVVGLQARNPNWKSKVEDGVKELTIGPVVVPWNADLLLEDADTVHIAEGVTDALSLLELGIPAVGIPGTANWRSQWVRFFDRARNVVIAFDNDPPGRKASKRAVEDFRRAGRAVKVLALPTGTKDINDWLTARLAAKGGAA